MTDLCAAPACGHPETEHVEEIAAPMAWSAAQCLSCYEAADDDDGPERWEHAYVPGATCPTCGGTGKHDAIIASVGHTIAASGQMVDHYAPCPTCHGLRVVPLEVTSA